MPEGFDPTMYLVLDVHAAADWLIVAGMQLIVSKATVLDILMYNLPWEASTDVVY